MAILVTGAAGFIGYHLCKTLMEQGETVIGIDNLNDYYEVSLKKARLAELKKVKGKFIFAVADVRNAKKFNAHIKPYLKKIKTVIHLAAYAGIRHSTKNPYIYGEANLMGFLDILELCRRLPALEHLLYASSSSVYGNDQDDVPFKITAPANHAASFYGATKKANEVMAYTYSHIFGISATGLRFFTVYGPWGRPDMAYYLFTKAIFAGKPITVFNNGNMKRDFTYIDDIIAGIMACINKPPKKQDAARHAVYNLGRGNTEVLGDMIKILEEAAGKKAKIKYGEMPAGDVEITYADISASTKDFGFSPKTSIDKGLPKFVDWYRRYYKIK